jgi:Ca-activated chloride channel family protein
VTTAPTFLQAFHFLRPQWLLVLPGLWGIVVWLARRQAQRQDWARLIDPQLLPALRLAADAGVAARPWPWLALAWTLAGIALAGPAWQRVQTAAYRAPAAWALVLDLSPSMAATDLKPDRVTRARYALNDILAAAHDARVGLVVFSEEPFTVTPLTDDVATVRALLPPLAPGIMPSAGDRLAPALDQAARLFDQVPATERHIVVLTDGFDDPAAALAAAAQIKSRGIELTVVGVGTPGGAPLRSDDGRFAEDAQGRAALARLDVDRLRQVAAAGGGQYVDLAQLPDLLSRFQTPARGAGDAQAAPGVALTDWRDAGIWLLPVLLVLAAYLGRRGWL